MERVSANINKQIIILLTKIEELLPGKKVLLIAEDSDQKGYTLVMAPGFCPHCLAKRAASAIEHIEKTELH